MVVQKSKSGNSNILACVVVESLDPHTVAPSSPVIQGQRRAQNTYFSQDTDVLAAVHTWGLDRLACLGGRSLFSNVVAAQNS